ncbi:hypothetical protein AGR8A_Lc40375 [Agrobacterium fabrum str. J-07]|nr:hypothetical protein AGR8A_Lc40375 [Agrobacterium fabrum str. J-07]
MCFMHFPIVLRILNQVTAYSTFPCANALARVLVNLSQCERKTPGRRTHHTFATLSFTKSRIRFFPCPRV